MKKILLLFSAVGLLSLSSCNNDDDFDSDTIAEVFETQQLTFTAAGNYTITQTLNPSLLNADMILVYRLVQEANVNMDVWELVPVMKYFSSDNGEVELGYNYNFTQVDIEFSVASSPNGSPADYPNYIQNQIFRIVIIPGYGSNFRTTASAMEQFKDYDAVIKKYGIDDSKVAKLTSKK